MAVTQKRSGSEVIESTNPATGEILGTVPVHGEEQVAAAVRRARLSAEVWSRLSFDERRGQLFAWRRALAERAREVADLIHRETGKPMMDAVQEVMASLGHLHHAAVRAPRALARRKVSPGILANLRTRISYHPLGVIGVIGPWNFPMFTPMGSIAYALAAGNTVVFKPSELTPLVGQLISEIASETISTPGVIQLVTGDGRTGAALSRAEVDKIAFTGSPGTGRRIMAAAAERLTPVLLELGGKDPMIVAGDADVARAAQDAVFGALVNAGQACASIERCFVVSSVYQEFVERVREEVKDIRVGEQIGAITLPKQVDIIRQHLEEAVRAGATVVVGGPEAMRDNFVEPTVLTDVTPDMRIMREETFGPVLPIMRVESVEQAIELANDTSYGLGSSVFGKAGVREIADRIRSGMTAINSVVNFAAVPTLPFGGIGESGFGRIHGDEGIREFARVKATTEERFALPLNLLSFKLPEGTTEKLFGTIRQLYGEGLPSKIRDRVRRR